nr:hypothetical protein [Clostridia bacterium]
MSMVYKWKTAYITDKGKESVSAQKVGEEFERIEKEYGILNPKTIVDRAKDENNVLHPYFEWNDEIAGYKYRLSQASTMLCSISVVQDENTPASNGVRAFYNVTRRDVDEDTTYRHLKSILSNQDDYDIVLKKAEIEYENFKAKYEKLLKREDLEKIIYGETTKG